MSRYRDYIKKHCKVESEFGDEILIFCPFHHNAHTASCCVNVQRGLFICYSCQAKGHISQIAQKIRQPLTEHYDPKSLKKTLRSAGRDDQHDQAVKRYSEDWLDQYDRRGIHDYWRDRGLSDAMIREYRLGFGRFSRADGSVYEAATIPVRDVNGNVMGVIRRVMDPEPDEPKYLYPKGFKISWHLFNACRYSDNPYDRPLVITEGSIDALLMIQEGYPSVSLLGSVLHPHQRTILSSMPFDTVVLMLDNDKVGRHAAKVAAAALMGDGFNVLMSKRYKGCKDAGDMKPETRRKSIEDALSYMRLRIGSMSA